MSNRFKTNKKALSELEEYSELVHKKIHRGKYFSINAIGELNAGAKNKFLIETGDMYLHMTQPALTVDSGVLRVSITLLPTVSNFGTAVGVLNHNQQSSLVSSLLNSRQGCTFSADGTILFDSYVFAGKSPGSNIPAREEYILKANTKYGIIIENVANAKLFYSLFHAWYETDENYNESEV